MRITNSNQNLWAVTCYFNPAGYRRRLENFKAFRKGLAVPLVAVELGHGQRFDLGDSDAEILIQLRSPDVMWQKERLLNIGFAAVPAGVDKVAWLDCDVLLAADDWAESVNRQLDEFNVVHLLRRRVNLPSAYSGCFPPEETGEEEALSTIHEWTRGYPVDGAIADSGAPLRLKQTLGLAWAARREILDQHGLYDAAIMGSADRLIAAAALGRFTAAEQATRMNEVQRTHYRRWAEPFYQSVKSRVSYLDQTIYHLWHGDLRNRAYAERHDLLRRFEFDPCSDLRLDESACWGWNSDKPELHRHVKDYFAARREDG